MTLNFMRKIVLAALIFGGGFALGSAVVSSADGLIDPNQPGSVNDPLVTKSYVDEQVAKAVKSELEKQKSTGNVSASRELLVVELNPGESLIAGSGAEFIVRNGKAVAIGGKDGIPDITDGDSIADGELIPLNHLLLFPRDDGRGIQPHPDQKTTVFVMVRGSYVHLDASGKAK
jgi:hypothetical protein